MKHGKLRLDLKLLEEILTARNNDFVETNCPQDVKIVRVIQDSEDLLSHRVTLVLESESADWLGSRIVEGGTKVVIPFLEPFEYTVIDPVEPPAEETPDERHEG